MRDPLTRFKSLRTTSKQESPKPDSDTRPFVAAALLDSDQDDADLIALTQANFAQLKDGVGWNQAPNGGMRWIYAAMITARAAEVSEFLATREALRDAVKASGTGSLHAGGARAALVLSLSPEGGVSRVPAFFEMKRALRPPWWRSDVAITDTFAAAHALTDARSEEVRAARDRARDVFSTDRQAKGHRNEGARLTVLREDSADAVLARFQALEAARKADRYLRGRTDRTLAMEWAASGRSASDLPKIAEVLNDLPKGITSMGYAQARLAQMIAFPNDGGDPIEGATALAAVVAAQAAMMTVIIASTVAVTSSAGT